MECNWRYCVSLVWWLSWNVISGWILIENSVPPATTHCGPLHEAVDMHYQRVKPFELNNSAISSPSVFSSPTTLASPFRNPFPTLNYTISLLPLLLSLSSESRFLNPAMFWRVLCTRVFIDRSVKTSISRQKEIQYRSIQRCRIQTIPIQL